MKYKIIIRLLLVFMILFFPFTSANAKEATMGKFKFTYQYYGANGIWITHIDIMKDKGISTLKIPSRIAGYPVVKLGTLFDDDDWFPADSIFGMYRSEDDEKIAPVKVAKKVAKIQKIVLPNTVEEITPNCFQYIQKGKNINVPAKLTKNVVCLCGLKWKKLRISPKNREYRSVDNLILSKDGKRVYGYAGMDKKVFLPKGVQTIEERAFWNSHISKITIPKTVRKIKSCALDCIKSLTVSISSQNKNYAVKSGCIYSKKSGRLVAAIPRAGVITVPDQVTCLKDGTSFAGGTVKKIIFPASLKKIGKYWNLSLTTTNKCKCIFRGKKAPSIDKVDVHMPDHSKVFVPKKGKSSYAKAFKEWIEWGDITLHTY